MTCVSAREYLFAFIDGELDAALSIEFQRHIEHCPTCAREVEIERAIRRSIVRAVEAVPVGEFTMPRFDAEPDFSNRAVRALRLPRRRGWISIGVAAVVVLGVWVWLGGLSSRSGANLPNHLVSDFEHFMADGRSVQKPSGDLALVSRWLRAETEVPIQLASAAPAGWRLLGGRKCVIDGKPAAFAAFERESDRATASVVGIVGSADILKGMRVVRDGDETRWAMRCRGHTVLACARTGVIYAVVSKLPHDDLVPLMQSGAPVRGSEP